MLLRAPWLLRTLIGIVLLSPVPTSAQSFADLTNANPLTVSVSPQYPAPYSTVLLTPASGVFDLAAATMTVSAGGKELYRGAAQPTSVTLGAAGTLTTIKVVLSANGTSHSQIVSVRPQDVSLVAEPLSSGVPLYPGKPLVPLSGQVRFVAIANMKSVSGKTLDPAILAYTWSIDGVQLVGTSGIGKNATIVDSPLQYRARDVSVTVTSPDGSVAGGAALSFGAHEPVVRLYENDPLLGIRFEKALSGSFAIANEASLYAAPYSFPTTNGSPTVNWFLNGSSAQMGNLIILRPTGSGQGSASLSAVAAAGDSARATTDLSVSFGRTSSGFGLFGL